MNKRTSQINFRANDFERKALERMAAVEGRPMSEMLRELVREGAQKRALWPVIETQRQNAQAA